MSGWASAQAHTRTMLETPRRRRRCHCGCGGRATHMGLANGIGLMSGCEFYVRRWVKDWRAAPVRGGANIEKDAG
jgi:hypothetical protein